MESLEQHAIAAEIVDKKRRSTLIASWTPEKEKILQIWGEKAAGYRFLHHKAYCHYKKLNDRLSLTSIFLSTIAGIGSMGMTAETSTPVMYSMVFVNMCAALCASLQKFYKCAEKSELNLSIERQYGALYTSISTELMLSPDQRSDCNELSQQCRMEYDRLCAIAPPVPSVSVRAFKQQYAHIENKPEVANGLREIVIYDRHTNELKADRQNTLTKFKGWRDAVRTKISRKDDEYQDAPRCFPMI